MSLTFEEACNLINDLPKFTTKHSMEESRSFLDMLGNPERDMRIIHVAGTNGKGSVCVYTESILMHAGYKTGCFLSPHLIDMRERIRISGKLCSKEDFADAVDRVKKLAERSFYPTFFEFLFYTGMLIFKKQNVDILILETGLGGRLDATNLPEKKELCIIPSIGLDHMQYLGDTVDKIAVEKAGIFRKGIPAVFWDKRENEALKECADRTGAESYALSKSVISDIIVDNATIDFLLSNNYDNNIWLTLTTRAMYQVENAALAVTALQIWDRGKTLSADDYREGLMRVHFEGRMEEVADRIYVDGAHNEPAMVKFLETVATDGATERLLIFGCMHDKDYETEIAMITDSGLFDIIIPVDIGGRSEKEEVIRKLFENRIKGLSDNPGVNEKYREPEVIGLSSEEGDSLVWAVKSAEAFTGENKNSFAYITGSLYLVGEIKRLFS